MLDKTVQLDQAVAFDPTARPEPLRRAAPAGRLSTTPAGSSSAAADGPIVAGASNPATSASAPATGASQRAALAADIAALAIRSALDRLSGTLARAAAAFVRLRAWNVFGFARLEDHARERYGRSGRWLRDLAALGDGIAAYPGLADALTGTDGGRPLGRVAATLVARSASLGPDTLADWIAAARSLSVRDLRTAIRQARATAEPRTDAPTDTGIVPEPDAGRQPGTDADPGTDPDEDRVLLRLPVPLPVLAAFEESLDLHRALEGHASPVTAFVEALVGEAHSAGAAPPPGFVAPLEHGTPEAQVEAALRRASDAWANLPEPHATVAAAGASLARFSTLEAEAGQGDAAALNRQIRALVRIENELEAELGRLLAAMAERRDWMRLRFASVGHYAEERLGMSRSRAGERARLARALRPLPSVAAACAAGRISMEAAALIHRILGGPSTSTIGDPSPARKPDDLETAWVEHAATTTIKRIRDEARALGLYRARTCAAMVCTSAAIAGTSATAGSSVCTAAATLGSSVARPRPLRDDRWGRSLRREAGTATRRILELGLRAPGLLPPAIDPEPDVFHPFPPLAAEPDVFHSADHDRTEPDVFHSLLPEPDVFLRLRLPGDLAADFLAAIEAARAALEARVASVPWDVEWPPGQGAIEPPSAWAARIAFVRGRRVPAWVGLLALLEDFAATWDIDAAAPERRDDRVFVRDGWRCAAPGCSSRRNLEVHHVVYRSRGGSDDGWNLVTLCRFHHQRGEHGGLMSVRGKAPLGLTCRLGRDDVAIVYRNERWHPTPDAV